MTFRTKLAQFIGRASQQALQLSNRTGGSLPGKIANHIDPNVLKNISQDYDIILVTGTNGKTMTTSIATDIFETSNQTILTNPTGSNMIQGVTTSFLTAPNISKGSRGIAIIEVDEASLRHVTKQVQAKVICITNLFPDQTDRYATTQATFDVICEGIAHNPDALIITNGDSPIFNSFPLDNEVIYFGFNTETEAEVSLANPKEDSVHCPKCGQLLHYKEKTYANLGNYFCPNGHFKRPELTYQVEEIGQMTSQNSQFTIDGTIFSAPLTGTYNIYNALAAYSMTKQFNISNQAIQEGLNQHEAVFGRQENLKIAGKDVVLNLVKNPVGFNRVIDTLELIEGNFTLVSILNDQAADGTDISWIEEADYERLQSMPIKQVIIGGIRVDDLSNRLIQAGFSKDRIIRATSTQDIITKISKVPTQQVAVLSTYTALLELREELAKKGLVKEKLS